MKNDWKALRSDLIPLLIKYKKCTGSVFPIERVSHLKTDVIVEKLRDCIKNNKKYEISIYKFCENDKTVSLKEQKKILISDKSFKNIIPLIKLSMNYINYDYESDCKEILDIINLRKMVRLLLFQSI